MLNRTWLENRYRLEVLRVTNGLHREFVEWNTANNALVLPLQYIKNSKRVKIKFGYPEYKNQKYISMQVTFAK